MKRYKYRNTFFQFILALILMALGMPLMAQAPTATTGAATGISSTDATVNGTVNANGFPTTVSFEYGLTTEYGQIASGLPGTVSGSTDTPVMAILVSLDVDTTYHYRIKATNVNGTTYGVDMTFTTLEASGSPPIAVTTPATGIGADSATLNGEVSTFGESTTVIFQWGTDTSYGNSVTADQSPVNGTLEPVTATLSGLANNTMFHYRVVASNANGTAYGMDMFFTIGTVGGPPTATTNAATGIGSITATLNGTVDANDSSTVVTFEYGTTTAYGTTVVAGQSPVTGTTATPVSAALTSFLPNTTYHYRVTATNVNGSDNGADMTFTTLPTRPTAVTDTASPVGTTTATLNGTVNANGDSTTVTFEYGPTSAYGTTVTADQSPVTGLVDTAVSKAITGLTNGITYHYRVVATNASGTTYGSDMTFTAGAPPPTAVTNAASGIGATSATFNGTVNANNNSTTVTFEYGETPAYGRTALAVQSPVTGSTNTAVNVTVTDLAPNITYHFRVKAESVGGTTYGADMTFTTVAAPTVITNGASAVTTSGATLNGTVNANGNSTTVTFQYGTTPTYGTTVTADQSPVTGNTATAVSKAITGLTINTTYHYRVVGQNAQGTVYGADMTFVTSVPGAPIVTTDAATHVMQDSAILNGTVNANNDNTTVTFEYGTTTAYGTTVTAVPGLVTGTANTPVSVQVSGLTVNTLYYYRVKGVNGNGAVDGNDMTFMTTTAPIAVTLGATSVTATSATLNGTANANYDPGTSVGFEYDSSLPNPPYDISVPASPSTISGSSDYPAFVNLTGLTPNTTYYYRIYGSNSLIQTTYGAQMTFTTLPGDTPPTAATDPASAVGGTTATLNGTVNANNSTTTVTFEYGLDTNYGQIAVAVPSPVTGSTPTAVSSGLTTLAPNTTYYYRVKAENAGNTVYGTDMTFTTGPLPPNADTTAPTAVSGTGATLNGIVNANNDSTTVTFEYGLTPAAYGTTVTADQSPVTGATNTAVSKGITGLANNTTYHYRVVAQNGAGTTYGADMTFLTGTTPPTVTTGPVTNIGSTSVTLNGTVNASNASTTVTFEYGETIGYGRTVTADQSPVTGSIDTAVSFTPTDLLPNTTYHYQAVGQNASGTTYGVDMTFTTNPGNTPTVTTANVTDIAALSATSGGNVTNEGGAPVTARGVCWSTFPTPTTADNITSDGTGAGAFTSSLTGLNEVTTYYVRAYATNIYGTAYGEEFQFTTNPGVLPTVTTANVTNITAVSATSGGDVTDEGDAPVTARGVCWSTAPNPTIANNRTTDGTGPGAFTSNLINLNEVTTYYVRAYATNLFGTAYGSELQFTTNVGSAPTVTTVNVTNITAVSAESGGNVTDEGDTPVTARGVCWSTASSPTTADGTTSDGTGPGAFTSNLTGLTANTTYYVRAYATNSFGTGYGSELQFTTSSGIPIAATTNVTNVTAVSAESGGNVADEGDAPVTARGVCWSTAPNPTTADNTTSDGTGPGAFTSNLTGLTPATTYYVRAYATNLFGTSYGSQLQFTTNTINPPTVTTANVTNITTTSAASGGNVIDEGDAPVTARGVCWSTAPSPTTADNTTSDGTGPGAFTSSLTSLTPNTIYYVRAYATNSYGTAYGSELQFTTNTINPPTVTTANVTNITADSAASGGNVINQGDAPVTARGVCWSTTPHPTTADNTTSDGTGGGSFTSSLTGLTPNTIYYVRAYATNSYGTSFGNQLQFTTGSGVISVNITEPGDGEVVSGTVTIAASASVSSSDTSTANSPMALSIAKVEFYIDDSLTSTDTTQPYETQWDTSTASDGSHTIKAVAYDQSDNSAQDEITVTVSNIPPEIMLNRINLNYGSIFQANSAADNTMGGTVTTKPQTVLINNIGGGTLNWSIGKDAEWLSCSPGSGTGPGQVTVTVDPSDLAAGSYSATITVSDPNATNNPVTLPVNLTVYNQGTTGAPFGVFATPIHNSTVMSSIPVTGWVLDDIEVTDVKIYRAPLPGHETGMIYIGDAVFVDGARPDVEAAYPDYPLNYQAGWGYMMLTNSLPFQGNGTFKIYAKATDKEGNTVTLGSKTIHCDNANAVKPFGAIDTPDQGGIASGKSFVNFGWALTPQPNTIPIDGSTIYVWVDGVPLGHPVYNKYRPDIADLFPGYNNSDRAGGYFYLDTTKYINGVHTISWSAEDNAGNVDGIGSRYFTIVNTKGMASPTYYCCRNTQVPEEKSWNENKVLQYSNTDSSSNLIIKELEYVALQLVDENQSVVRGFLEMDDRLSPLPIGSTLDMKNGIFFWHPGPGFLGQFNLVFVIESTTNQSYKKPVTITIEPK